MGWHWRLLAVACGLVLVVETLLVGDMGSAEAADIRSTPHNLSRSRSVVETDEVCVFCHTPQIPLNGVGTAMRPAWQSSLPSTHDFLMFDDIGRQQFGKLAVGTQSIACLSCHDGGQALSVTKTESDHPYGVPYRGFRKGGGFSQVKNEVREEDRGDLPFKAAQHLKELDDFRPPSEGKVDNRSVWWVSSGGVSAVRTRSDLPLYARREGDGEIPYIECSSCHDPHVVRPLFLRVNNEGSKLCLTCHDK